MNWFRITFMILFTLVLIYLGNFLLDVGIEAKRHCLIWSKGTTSVCTIGFIPKGIDTVVHRRTVLNMFVGELNISNPAPQVLQSVLLLFMFSGILLVLLWRNLQLVKLIYHDLKIQRSNDPPEELPNAGPRRKINPIFVLFLLILIASAMGLNEFFKRYLINTDSLEYTEPQRPETLP